MYTKEKFIGEWENFRNKIFLYKNTFHFLSSFFLHCAEFQKLCFIIFQIFRMFKKMKKTSKATWDKARNKQEQILKA